MSDVPQYSLRYILVAVCGVVGCGPKPSGADHSEAEAPKADTRFEENKALFASIRDADQLNLYEGLPRHPEKVEEEKRRNSSITLRGFPFYSAPVEIRKEDAVKLKGLLADERSFFPWRGEKKCGGFHPDYLAEYRVGDSVFQFLLCFGCHEVMVFGPERSLRCDIQGAAYEEFEALLNKHHEKREK